MQWTARSLLVAVAVVASGGVAASCAAEDFDPVTKVDSVRMFAARADRPYAKPGETVTLEVLAADGRRDPSPPMTIAWIPLLCQNPPNDLYYLCFTPAAKLTPIGLAASGASAGGGASFSLDQIPPGVDLTPLLPKGPKLTFIVPEDVVQPRTTTATPYGLMVVFNIACAGKITYQPPNAEAGPQQLPIACTNASGERVPPSDYVIGLTRIYSYPDRKNENPVIESITLDSVPVDVRRGVEMETCKTSLRRDCPKLRFDVRVAESSWEVAEGAITPEGIQGREQVWYSVYSDIAEVGAEARLLFDATRGAPPETFVELQAPNVAGDGNLWVIVHDSRGGAAWSVLPLRAR